MIGANPWPEVRAALLRLGAEMCGETVPLDRYGSHQPTSGWLRRTQARATKAMYDAARGELLPGWSIAVWRPDRVVTERTAVLVAIDPLGRMHTIDELADA